MQDVHGSESMFINALKKKRFPSVENFKVSVYGMVQVGDLIPSNLNCLTIVRSKSTRIRSKTPKPKRKNRFRKA